MTSERQTAVPHPDEGVGKRFETPTPADPSRRASQPGVLAAIPRRTFLKPRPAETAPPQMRTVTFTASATQILGRLIIWVDMLARFAAAVLWDWLRRKGSPAKRAAHLRRAFERTGGTFIRIGQHLGMRLDLLPWDYGSELSRMRDRVPAFPVERAIDAVQRTTGKPLAQTFERFDPEPVGSSAIACTYQAILASGERVVVKVRRPGIGELFMADLKVLDWLALTLEFLTVLRPGFTATMRRELRETLLEELDFVQEARYQDLFRRAARRSGKRFFTAPRVYFELSGEEVVVAEFVSGMWLWELVAGVEQKNHDVLGLAARLNIDPARIAKRLAFINYWAWHEHLFFRADPHPDKIIIAADGRLTFIDFGSSGTIDRTKRRALQENMYYAWRRDPRNMARTSLILLEPLPAVDPIELVKKLETWNREMLFAFEMEGADQTWFKRTSALQWIGLVQVARRHHIDVDFHVLRILRGSVLFDTLAVRLDPDIDVVEQYRSFAKYRARRARKRARHGMLRQAARFPDDNSIYLQLERLAKTGETLAFQLRHSLTIHRANYTPMIGKGAFITYTGIRVAAELLVTLVLVAAGIGVARYLSTGEVLDSRDAAAQALAHPAFAIIALLIVFLNTRALWFRMGDRDA